MAETLRIYKFLVTPVLQVVDDNGEVINERIPQQPETLFGIEALHLFADTFENAINANNNGGSVVHAGESAD